MNLALDYSFHQVLEALEAEEIDEAYDLCTVRIDDSQDPQRWFLLGHIQRIRADKEGALAAFHKTYSLCPEWIDAVFEYACGLQDVGRHEEAVPLFKEVYAEAASLVVLRKKYAFSLRKLGRYEEALSQYEGAIALESERAELWAGLAATYLAWGRAKAAVQSYGVATTLEPNEPELWYNLGSAALQSHELDVALDALTRAVELAPEHYDAHLNLGLTLKSVGRCDEAVFVLRRAIGLQPDGIVGHWNLAMSLLMREDYREGWTLYESRRHLPNFSIQQYEFPAWEGSICSENTLLIHAEQGMGDTFQFVRFLGLAKERVGRLILAVQPPLKEIISRLGIADEVIGHDESPVGVDVQAPLLSLPYLLRSWDELLPDSVPYMSASPELVAKWKVELEGTTGLRIGVCWQGNPSYKDDYKRSVPVAHFSAIMERADVNVFSLQKFHGVEQLNALNETCRYVELGSRLDTDVGAFMDTAAVIANLDLVITSDTSMAHLAGSLGVPVWVVLPHVPDWRWGIEGSSYGWYPNMRLFRQSIPGDWEGTFVNVVAALEEMLST